MIEYLAMQIGIIGLPSAGKTTLFNIVTKNFVQTGGFSTSDAPNIGVAQVPDPRLTWLSNLYKPKKPSPRPSTSWTWPAW